MSGPVDGSAPRGVSRRGLGFAEGLGRVASWRVTRDGWVVLGGGSVLGFVGFWSANNLLLLVAAPLLALALLSVPLGWRNLLRIRVARTLPAELFAGREALGRLVLTNGGRLSSADLTVTDEGTTAHAALPLLAGRAEVGARARWRFTERGAVELTRLRVSSRWPFGLTEHVVLWSEPAEVVVFPRPLPSSTSAQPWSGALGAEPDAAGHGAGDFVGLRAYREGDPPNRVHWPTSARIGELIVVDRAGETEVSVEVVVRPLTGARWERELSTAAGEVLRAFHHGRKVGLVLPAVGDQPARRLPPGSGEAWRRTLLEAIALLPRVP